MNLQSKYVQDKDGVKYAPITVPQAVRWSNGDDLDDKLSEKANKVDTPTSGNFAAVDANGNIVDSGHKHSDYLTQHQSLANYIQKSNTSGLVKNDGTIDTNTYLTQHQDISGKEDVTTIVAPVNATDATLPITTLTTEIGKYYRIDVPIETLGVTLPAMTDLTTVRTVVLYLTGGTTPAITISSTAVSGGTAPAVYYQDGFKIEAGKTYEINALFNGDAWIVSALTIILPPPPMNIITYEASKKLAETTTSWSSGLHTNAFSGKSGQLTMTSHTFENGVGTVEFNGDVTSIGANAFFGCSGLTSITIPDSITSIGDNVFNECSGLTSITIGSGVTSIGHATFQTCTSLTSITSLATTAPTIQYDTFEFVKTGGTLYVPSDNTGYDVWMGTGDFYLGSSNWTKVEQ